MKKNQLAFLAVLLLCAMLLTACGSRQSATVQPIATPSPTPVPTIPPSSVPIITTTERLIHFYSFPLNIRRQRPPKRRPLPVFLPPWSLRALLREQKSMICNDQRIFGYCLRASCGL